MDIVKIQALISQGKIVEASQIDPEKAYVQLGVFQNGNRLSKASDPNSYSPYAISLAEVASLSMVETIQPISGTLNYDGRVDGPQTLVISVPQKPKYIIFSADTRYIVNAAGNVIKDLTDPVGSHALTYYGFSAGNGFGSDYANIMGLNFSQYIKIENPAGAPIGKIPNQFPIQQPVCFLTGMRWEDMSDAGNYGTCTNFTNNSFTLNITPYGTWTGRYFISVINWTAFF